MEGRANMKVYYHIGHCLVPGTVRAQGGGREMFPAAPVSHQSKICTMCINSPGLSSCIGRVTYQVSGFHFPAGNGKSEDGSREGTAGVLDEILWVVTAWGHLYFPQNKWSMARKTSKTGRIWDGSTNKNDWFCIKIKRKIGKFHFFNCNPIMLQYTNCILHFSCPYFFKDS